MYNFPNNPTVGQIAQFPSASQQYIWNGSSWDGAPLSAQFVTGSGGTSVSSSYSDTASLSYYSISSSYALTASYISGAIQSDPILIAGPGIRVNGLQISSSLLSVNGTYPDSNGNVSTALTEVITGTSASLILSSSGDVTSSITEGSVWVVSGDGDPSQNGKSWIYSFDGSIGTWYPLSSLDIPAADARYLMLNPQAPLSGPLTAPSGVIGTASWSDKSVYAITASYLLGNNIIPTEIVWPDPKHSGHQWGINFAYGNKVFAVGSDYSFRTTGIGSSTGQSGQLGEIPVLQRPGLFTKMVVNANNIHALGNNGVAYSYGVNSYGQLAIGNTISDASRWMQPITHANVSGSGKIVLDIFGPRDWVNNQSDNNLTSVIFKVNDNGTLKYLGVGRNLYANLGIGNTIDAISTPTENAVMRGKNIVSMSIGSPDGSSVLALVDDGTVWSWGYNNVAQLGIGNNTNTHTPVQAKSGSGLQPITNAIDVQSCYMSDESSFSWYNTFVLKSDGTVLGCGNGADYLRGDGQNSASAPYFTDVKTSATTKLQSIVKLYCKGFFRGALDSSGNLWAWGRNRWGQYGDGTAEGSIIQWARIIATGVEDVNIDLVSARISRLFIKQGGVWYASGYNSGYACMIGYRDGGNLPTRQQMAIPSGKTVKRFINVGNYATNDISGLILQTTDNSLYMSGYLQWVLGSPTGWSAVPNKINWNLD